jgi:hypothetical protein
MAWMFSKAKAVVNRMVGDPTKRLMQTFMSGTRPTLSYQEFLIADAAMKHPVVSRCINKIGLSCQGVRWFVELTGEKGVTPPSAATLKAIQRVLDDPCDTMDPAQFKYWLAINKACYGRWAVKIGRNISNDVGALYPLAARHLSTVVKQTGQIDYYEYGTGQNVERLQTRRQVDPGRKNEFSAPFAYEYVTPGLNPIGMIANIDGKNNSPLNALGLPAEIITMLLQRAHDTASGRANLKYIVSAEKTLTVPQEDELRGEFDDREVGAEKSGNVLLITNTSVKVDTLDDGMSDIHSKVPLDDMTRMIYSAFGIPIALGGIGSSDAAKFAGNYNASRQSLYEDTIIPAYLDPIAAGLTNAICPPGCRIRFDYDSIEALSQTRADKALKLTPVTFLTGPEKRVQIGFPAEGGPPEPETSNTTPAAGTKDETT